ncbi:MAG: Nif3-like dinuclear metal center hexameric protein [Christensenellaceae bacterium]
MKEFYDVIERYYPIKLSDELVKADNGYDNSGIIFDNDKPVTKAVFSLDLTRRAVDYAMSIGANTILTHHPAIYSPVKRIDGALKYAVTNGVSVISMHLNFDSAPLGIDHFLAQGLSAENPVLLQVLPSGGGYGRVFDVDLSFSELIDGVQREFDTTVRAYGDRNRRVLKVASFCGAGLSEEFLNVDADVFVSSDVQHHKILHALENGKCVIDITHYKSENYGMKKIFDFLSDTDGLKDVKMYFFCDERFI